jgi:cytosine/adenosine deaminase-related metal-dependent hydrolase
MTTSKIIVKAGRLVSAYDQPVISGGAVAVSGNTIEAVGTYSEISSRYPDADEIGGDQFLLLPGLINGHSHGRGLTDFQRGALDNTLESWLLDTGKYIPVTTYDDIAFSATKLLKSGVTTTMDNHIAKDPIGYEKEFDETLQAYNDTGMRVQFNPAIRNDNPFVYGDNREFLTSLPEGLRKVFTSPPSPDALTGENFVEMVTHLHKRCDAPMSRIGFGPLAPQWCTKELLLQVRKAADNLGRPIHVHAVQSIFQKIYGLEVLGRSLIEYMNNIAFLGPGLVIGHCVWPTESDLELLAKTHTAVTHHPSCNLRVRNGIAPVFHMLQAGVLVGLGLDGKSINDDDDLIQEMKVCFLLHRIPSLDLESPHMSARQVFQMVTENNASLLGYGGELGRLEPGRFADLILLDYEKMSYPFVDPSQDPIDTLLYRGLGRHVDTVMVNGRVVVEKGRLLTLDEEAIGARLAEAASRPRTEKEKELVKTMDELKDHVKRHYKGWTNKVEQTPYFNINSRIDGMK